MLTDTFSATLKPIEQAAGLANEHYIDPAVYAEECKVILAANWTGIGVGAAIPEPGDAHPIEFLGVPLLLLRDMEGIIRVFHNICRHRGMILVEEPRKIEGVIRCPYHSWCYRQDGALISTPHVGGPGMNIHPAIKRSELGLLEVKSYIWRDVIYVNLDGSAKPFEVANRALLERWAEFETPLHHGGKESHFTLDVQCNWKLAVENYSESYHLPWVHPGLNSYSRLEDHYNIHEMGFYAGQGTEVYRQLQGKHGEVFPDFPELSEKWNKGAEYITLFPNVLLGIHRDHSFVIILEPLSYEKTREHIHIYYAQAETNADMRAHNSARWKEVFIEDIFVVEGMQKGRHVPNFDGGRFSPVMEGPTYCFHSWIAEQLQKTRQKQKEA